MKTIGIIGGLSWFSTSVYYQKINQLVNERLGSSHAAKIWLHSIDFEEFRILQERNDWETAEKLFTAIALQLQSAGADCLLIASNTPHLVAGAIRAKMDVPFIHIAEETAREIVRRNIKTVGLLGTKFTMEHPFFKDVLTTFGIETIVPNDSDRKYLHATIFGELTKGIVRDTTREEYRAIIERLRNSGAQAIVFGCTEIALLLHPDECVVPVFDTASIHAEAAVNFALADEGR